MITTDVSLNISLKVQTMWFNRNYFIAYRLPKTISTASNERQTESEENLKHTYTLSRLMVFLFMLSEIGFE